MLLATIYVNLYTNIHEYFCWFSLSPYSEFQLSGNILNEKKEVNHFDLPLNYASAL